MIKEIRIRNFAIIENLAVSFDKGLNVLTGETGAGKSIIIDALNLCSGAEQIPILSALAKPTHLSKLFLKLPISKHET